MSPWARLTPRHTGSGPEHCQACQDLAEQGFLGSDTGWPAQFGGSHAMRLELNEGPRMPDQGTLLSTSHWEADEDCGWESRTQQGDWRKGIQEQGDGDERGR